MIVYSNWHDLLGMLLSYNILIKHTLDFMWCRKLFKIKLFFFLIFIIFFAFLLLFLNLLLIWHIISHHIETTKHPHVRHVWDSFHKLVIIYVVVVYCIKGLLHAIRADIQSTWHAYHLACFRFCPSAYIAYLFIFIVIIIIIITHIFLYSASEELSAFLT